MADEDPRLHFFKRTRKRETNAKCCGCHGYKPTLYAFDCDKAGHTVCLECYDRLHKCPQCNVYKNQDNYGLLKDDSQMLNIDLGGNAPSDGFTGIGIGIVGATGPTGATGMTGTPANFGDYVFYNNAIGGWGTYMGSRPVAYGTHAGTNGLAHGIAIGYQAGQQYQNTYSVAFGYQAG